MKVLGSAHLLKRQGLIDECAQQRRQLALCVSEMQLPIQRLDRVMAIWHALKQPPWLMLCGIALFKRFVTRQRKRDWTNRMLTVVLELKLLRQLFVKMKKIFKLFSS